MLGTELVLNEFTANLDLVANKDAISPRSYLMATFALYGFANFAAVGIQIESRKQDIARLAQRAMVGGAIATMMTAAVAGVFFQI